MFGEILMIIFIFGIVDNGVMLIGAFFGLGLEKTYQVNCSAD